MSLLERAEAPVIRLRITPRPIVEDKPSDEAKLSELLTFDEAYPPKRRPDVIRLINAIDQQELSFYEAAKLLAIYFMWEDTSTVQQRMAKIFGEDVETRLGLKLDHISIRNIRQDYINDETLNNGYSQVLYALGRNK